MSDNDTIAVKLESILVGAHALEQGIESLLVELKRERTHPLAVVHLHELQNQISKAHEAFGYTRSPQNLDLNPHIPTPYLGKDSSTARETRPAYDRSDEKSRGSFER